MNNFSNFIDMKHFKCTDYNNSTSVQLSPECSPFRSLPTGATRLHGQRLIVSFHGDESIDSLLAFEGVSFCQRLFG